MNTSRLTQWMVQGLTLLATIIVNTYCLVALNDKEEEDDNVNELLLLPQSMKARS